MSRCSVLVTRCKIRLSISRRRLCLVTSWCVLFASRRWSRFPVHPLIPLPDALLSLRMPLLHSGRVRLLFSHVLPPGVPHSTLFLAIPLFPARDALKIQKMTPMYLHRTFNLAINKNLLNQLQLFELDRCYVRPTGQKTNKFNEMDQELSVLSTDILVCGVHVVMNHVLGVNVLSRV
jgi:hypothetical protein